MTGSLLARAARHRLWLAVAAILLIAAVCTGIMSRSATAEPNAPAIAEVMVSEHRAAELVAATGASLTAGQAKGERAQIINASLPFSTSPIQAAKPFELSADGLDRDRALLCLTQAVYYEAGFEPLAGRRAVAQVVLNRMRHPAFPKSVCGVVYQGSRSPVCQFSFVCDGSLDRAPAASAWSQARQVADSALAGYVEESVGSATHYHADYVAPRWAPMLTKVQKLGAHIFYRWPGTWGQRAAFTGRYAGEPVDPAALKPAVLPEENPVESVDPPAEIARAAAPRAPNDVGGLLDTSKGWTLDIPTPDEVQANSFKALAEQQAVPQQPAGVRPAGAQAVAR